jgi:hypothetical protein
MSDLEEPNPDYSIVKVKKPDDSFMSQISSTLDLSKTANAIRTSSPISFRDNKESSNTVSNPLLNRIVPEIIPDQDLSCKLITNCLYQIKLL